MKTIGDILKLQRMAQRRNQGIGLAMSPEGPIFNKRMELLVRIAWRGTCGTRTVDGRIEYPPLDEMCKNLKEVDQATPLTVDAQAAFLCAFAPLLNSDNVMEDYFLVRSLMMEGFIPV